jgi:hypothetical protein
MRTAYETALLTALLFKRSNQKRIRVSLDTIRHLSERTTIRLSFIRMLLDNLDTLGLIMIENSRGGYSIIRSNLLDGAPIATAKKYLLDDLNKLKNGKIHFKDIEEELNEDKEDKEDKEDNDI